MALLEAEGVGFAYGRRPVVEGVSLALSAGEAVAVLGPNGSGKTTLLRLLLGLCRPRAGVVRLEGRPLARWPARALARRLAYVPQVHREAFPFTVREVVEMGRLPHRAFLAPLGAADRRAAGAALEELGIVHLADRPYTAVSGGERQLALIARAVAQEASIIVMDEPSNGLDYGNQVRLLRRIAALGRSGRTVVFSSHHPDHALAAAGRVILVQAGRLVADGPGAQVVTPAALRALYGVEARLLPTPDGAVCVPRWG